MKFLVVDDDFVTLSKLTAILGDLGTCEAATNGSQACSMIEDAIAAGEAYDVVVIDLNLPCQSGWSVLQTLRFKERLAVRESRKIIITSAGTQQNVVRSHQFRCDAFLVKPIKRDVLLEHLSAMGIPCPAGASPAREGAPEHPPSGPAGR